MFSVLLVLVAETCVATSWMLYDGLVSTAVAAFAGALLSALYSYLLIIALLNGGCDAQ